MRPIQLPDTDIVYAIGDIHGRLDLLEQAADMIDAHAGGRSHTVVCLGDYVDRGPDSQGVIEFLIRWDRKGGLVCLKGNHEAMLLDGFGEERAFWLGNGGEATLASYGGEIPREHLIWMQDLPVIARDAHRIYVHAGLMPRLELAEQDEDTCLWIRERFLWAPASALPAHVVHGHTPRHGRKEQPEVPERLAHRTNLDTGAWWTGVLAVGVFDANTPGGPTEILPVRGPPG